MKLIITGLLFSLLFSAGAKPGEIYILTGREKSVFGMFQTDLKAYPALYKDTDINKYYQEFLTVNNLGERKLQLGEEITFPDTAISKKLREAEAAKAARTARTERTEKAAKTQRTRRATRTPSAGTGTSTLFGSDRPSTTWVTDPEVEISSGETEEERAEAKKARAEAQKKTARHEAIYYYQHYLLPSLLYDDNRNLIEFLEKGNIDELVAQAQAKVDEPFAKALVLHAYPEKGIYVLEFEPPKKGGDYFFVALKKGASGRFNIYALERGISFFGVGDKGVLSEWGPAGDLSDLGGRNYNDLSSLLQELEAGRPVSSK
jgi:hypothetical protein